MQESETILKALIDEYDSHKEYIDGKIERGIEENRKGLFLLAFIDEDGSPVTVKDVKISQKSHEFKFGAPLFVIDQLDSDAENEEYKAKFKELFNYAVIPAYHKDVEPTEGNYRFDADSPFIWRRPPFDTVRNFCRENDLKMKLHCLVYNSFNPDFFKGMTNREININIEKYISEIGKRYGDDIVDMDVINEMFTIYKNCYVGNGCRDLPITDEADHISKMYLWAKRYFPNTHLFWNEGCFETFGNGSYKGKRSTYYMMLREQIEKRIPIEGIGMQYHLYATVGTSDGNLKEYKGVTNPLRLFDVLDCYSDFKLPIHISEISVPSYSNDKENELLQAELVKRVYRLFFSANNVESLIWWNFCDGMAFETESVFHTGLLRRDLSKKPAYDALYDLINKEWHTEYATSEAMGTLEFSGFFGDYEAEFFVDGQKYTRYVGLYKENTGFDNRLGGPRAVKIKL